MNEKRLRKLNIKEIKRGPIVYWMSRDQRVNDNWALIYAQKLSIKQKTSLIVIFCLVPEFLKAGIRQYGFMLKGLQEVEKELNKKNIPFFLLTGNPEKEVSYFVNKHKAGALITDFDPLKIKRRWKSSVKNKISIAFFEVDAHNIVPCWIASQKQEFGAYTLRPKIKRLLKEFLEEFPELRKIRKAKMPRNNWKKVISSLRVDKSVPEVDWLKPGEKEALKILNKFKKKVKNYLKDRNDPNKDALSNLSPYLHFGQISAQRVALEISSKAFLEELIIRKELADNFCFYNNNYDSTKGFPKWAKKTLNRHEKDKREYSYTKTQFERAKTYDKLWNAAQLQLTKTGKMHSYLRMYWAKKILEWTKTPEQAMKIAIYLNDKYELDGRDPNGYTGIAWSIGGVHDRAWPERKIFGKIRYMSYNGCKSKFDVDRFISNYLGEIRKG